MKSVFYEKAADEKNYIYYMDFPDMASVNYKFFGTHIHKSIEMVFVYHGKMSYSVNENKGVLNAGEILLINSYDSHSYEYIDNAGAFIFVFSLDLLDDVLTNNNQEFNNHIYLSNGLFETVYNYVKESYRSLDKFNLLEKKSFVLRLFGYLMHSNLFRNKVYVPNKAISANIMGYIEEHYAEDIDLITIANQFGYNRNYFSTVFNRIIGVNFSTYLNTYRMDKVQAMKNDPQYSNRTTEDIIYSCGFASAETYYRTVRKFKKNQNSAKEVEAPLKKEYDKISLKKLKAVIVGYGNRGQVYGTFSINEPDRLEIVGIVDPNPFKLKEAQAAYKLSDSQLYTNWEDFLKDNVEADFVINSTMDQHHYETAIQILKAGYNMLMEKPIVPNKQELLEIRDLAIKNKCQVFVCHVLRYTPFYTTIKQLINNGDIGKIMTMEMNEHVCMFHYLTSYDRGKWNNEKECGSGFLLAKCCHDMDLICWLNNSTQPVKVSSFAHRSEFVPANKPEGATEFCYNCPHKDTCPYDAGRVYLKFDPMPFLTWDNLNKPLDQITKEEKIENLKHTNFGRCAYDCGGDIVDRQNVLVDFDNGSLASFTLSSDTTKPDRYIHIVGNKGEIEGKLEENKIIVRRYNREKFFGDTEIIDCSSKVVINVKNGGHSGGDYMIMMDVCNYLNGIRDSISITSITDSVNGHLVVYAAEESRKTNKVIDVL